MFQALIGTVQTVRASVHETRDSKFQALIGTVQTIADSRTAVPQAQFQALIGTVQTDLFWQTTPRNP